MLAKSRIQLILLAVLPLAVFWPALRHDFLINWDDLQYVLENPTVQGLTLDHLRRAFTEFHIGNYAPIHLVSYMLDYELWGLRALGFILASLLIHTANGILFYLLLRRLSGAKAWILAAALVFALHPVQVESVVWVSQRKNLLAMGFFLLALHGYESYLEKGRGPLWYAASLTAFLLALLSKSVAVVLPLVLLLLDLGYHRDRPRKELILDKFPFLLLAAAFAFAAIRSHSAQFQGGATGYHGGSPYTTLLTMLPVLVSYVRLVLWPAGLSAFYDVPAKTQFDLVVAAAAAVCAGLAVLGVVLYRRRRDLFFWFALFFVGLIPVSQVVPIVTLMNDRYLYFPMLGAAAFASALVLGEARWPELIASRRGLARVGGAVAVLSACIGVTVGRIGVWQDSYTLWSDTVKKAPNVALVHDGLGEGLLQRGRIDEAIQEFQTALSLGPKNAGPQLSREQRFAVANTYNNLGAAYGMKGMVEVAIDHLKRALLLNPEMASANFNLGNALMNRGRVEEALRSFEEAVRLNPDNRAFHANLRQTREILAAHGRRQAGK